MVVLDNPWVWIAAVVVALVLVGVVIVLRRRAGSPSSGPAGPGRPHRDQFRPEGAEPPPPLKRAGVIVNPTKFPDVAAVRRLVTDTCLAQGWGEPIWLETTLADPGTGQARQAVREGASIVCSLGGDGTVRHVAAGLVGTQTPLGLLPGGTGNLLARNLDVPIDSIERALVVALTGHNARIDVGRLSVDPSGQHVDLEEHLFLVMAGLGFDATIMAGTTEELKAKVGSAAYVLTGLRNMVGPAFRARITVDSEPEFTRRTRTVLIGNVGTLLGGLRLMPEARADDGLLDAVLLSPRGVVGWSAVLGHVVTRNRRGHPLITRYTGTEIAARTETPQEVQIDGDPVGTARAISARLDRLALVVRVTSSTRPAPGPAS